MAGPSKPSPSPVAFVAAQSFVGNLDGRRVEFVKGEPVAAGNPAVAKWPSMFIPQEYRHERIERIEQATAAPGEKR